MKKKKTKNEACVRDTCSVPVHRALIIPLFANLADL